MHDSTYETLERALAEGGTEALFDRLTSTLREAGRYLELFEALLLEIRHRFGLPLEGMDSIHELPEHLQEPVERAYVEACREVGRLFLEQGDIPGAWPYFRAIDETDAVARAIDAWSPPHEEEDESGDDGGLDEEGLDQCDRIVDIAFHQGANPVRGFELILSQYGTCRAITTFEHQFPFRGSTREACAQRLVRHLYGELLESLRFDLERRELPVPEPATVQAMIEGRPELFGEHGYHVDISHLQSVVRAAPGLTSPEDLRLAVELCEYGRHLARDFQLNDPPPFEDFYNDHRILLRALAGEGVDGAVRYFRTKAERHELDEDGRHLPGEVLVLLLWRAGRAEEAAEAFVRYLGPSHSSLTVAPPLSEIAKTAGDFGPWLKLARENDNPLQYAAALVQRHEGATAAGAGD